MFEYVNAWNWEPVITVMKTKSGLDSPVSFIEHEFQSRRKCTYFGNVEFDVTEKLKSGTWYLLGINSIE